MCVDVQYYCVLHRSCCRLLELPFSDIQDYMHSMHSRQGQPPRSHLLRAWECSASYVSSRDIEPARHEPPETNRRSPRRRTKGTAPGMGPATLFQMSVLHERRRRIMQHRGYSLIAPDNDQGDRTPSIGGQEGQLLHAQSEGVSRSTRRSVSAAGLVRTRDGGAAILLPTALAVCPNPANASLETGTVLAVANLALVRPARRREPLRPSRRGLSVPWPALAPARGPTTKLASPL